LQPGLTIAEISAGYPFLVHVALASNLTIIQPINHKNVI
jgi:hypothetical protein